uniref:DUF1618 domain-containing protein n=1 Tax=Oryza punctata TaxID=4537 RepID=A0A0E0MP53_ORYPU
MEERRGSPEPPLPGWIVLDPCPSDLPEVSYPDVIAAHRGCILLVAAVPFATDPNINFGVGNYYPLDYFVYAALPLRPSLTRLPPCFVGGLLTDPEEDELYMPYHQQRQLFMCNRDVGLLCRRDGADGDGDASQLFTVADITSRSSEEVELCVVRSGESEWSITPLRVRRAMRKLGLDIGEWSNDAVLPLHDRFLCWVDYYQGILVVDPGDGSPEQFRFIPLPKRVRDGSSHLFIQSYCADPVRCVCVTVGEQEEERLAGEEEDHLGGVVQRTANHVLPFHLNLHASDQQEDMYSDGDDAMEQVLQNNGGHNHDAFPFDLNFNAYEEHLQMHAGNDDAMEQLLEINGGDNHYAFPFDLNLDTYE